MAIIDNALVDELERESSPPVAGPPSAQPKSRMDDPKKSLEVIEKYERFRNQRLDIYRMVNEQYDRVPPKTGMELESCMDWTTNVNWGSLEAEIDSSISPLFNLGTQGRTYIDLESDDHDGDENTPRYLRVLEQEDKRMLDRWEQWYVEYMIMLYHRKAFGLGVFHFDSPNGWHFSHVHPGNLIYIQNATLNIDKLPWIAIKTTFDVGSLALKLRSPDVAENAGWDTSAIRDALETVSISHSRDPVAGLHARAEDATQGFYEEYSRFEFDANVTSIEGYILYVREFTTDEDPDGKWSAHYIVKTKANNEVSEKATYIFSQERLFTNISEAIAIFPDNVSPGLLDRLRGVGVKKLPYHMLRDKLWNQTIDITWLTSSLILQSSGGDDLDEVQEIEFGPVTLIPEGLDIPQQRLQNPADGLVALIRETDSLESKNNSGFGSSSRGAQNAGKTLGEARLDFQNNTKLELFEIQFHQIWLGKFHRTRFLRAVGPEMRAHDPGYQDAQDMLARAERRGVPPEAVERISWIKAATVFGDGNPANQYLALQDIFLLRGDMTPDGRRSFSRDFISARLGSNAKADLYLGDDGVIGEMESDQRRIAQLENGSFQSSDAAITASQTDNDLIHLGEHTVFTGEIITTLDQGADMAQVFQIISRAMSHVGMNTEGQVVGGHLAEFSQDQEAQDTGAFAEIVRQWTSYVNVRRQLEQQLAARQQEAQQDQLNELQVPSLTVAEQNARLETESRIERENAAAFEDNRRKQESHDLDLALKQAQLTQRTQTRL